MDQRPVGSAYPRDLAVRVLTRVLSDSQPLDEVISDLVRENPQARSWLMEVCSGTLRWKGRVDAMLDAIALKKKPSGWLRKILSLAAYQLIAQDRTSPGKIVSETVDEVRNKEGEAPAKFANAVLRRISEQALQWRHWEYPAGSSLEDQARWASLPSWMWKKLLKQRGEPWARAYALACLERPQIWLHSKNRDQMPMPEAERGSVPGSWRVQTFGVVSESQSFKDGQWIVQDISSQILVHDFVALQKSQTTLTALDLCAAPGGKSVGMSWGGIEVIATDRDGPRLALLRETVARTSSGKIRVIERKDVAALAELPPGTVWVDAPCSGSGIIRRHPDVKWLKREQDVGTLKKIQCELLKEAWSLVRPGGGVLYSVCSVFEDEGIDVIKFCGLQDSVRQQWFLNPIDAPHGDGFFAAWLERPAADSITS